MSTATISRRALQNVVDIYIGDCKVANVFLGHHLDALTASIHTQNTVSFTLCLGLEM